MPIWRPPHFSALFPSRTPPLHSSSTLMAAATAPASESSSRRSNVSSTPPYVRAVAGSLGGVMEACCLQPIDVIKTRLQLDRAGAYRGIVHCGTTAVQTEGVRALWKGLTPFATHLTLKYALRMGSNAVLQSALKDASTGDLSHRGRIAAGFGAGVLEALLIVTPFEASNLLI
ncbi:mitochondrial succinate-fumarate transporter 1-like [Canna indica]|uniref:Mitochondrial succinate-fumarate transporter 1-like n=1 Tax=Canna indica TaxID=4628 RepID=A0AAQ3QHK1_9LILI|nr:mitochondrial succinate-fumarate transporter 1-like [Canna indica]